MPGAAGSRRAWGWHQLAPEWAERIVAEAKVQPGDLVLDIGAGAGALTAPLIRAGARVLAIELHPGRAQALRDRFAGANVTVVQANARQLLLPHHPFRVVANPPYSVASEVLRLLTAHGSRLVSAHLVLQRQLARDVATRSWLGRRWTVECGLSLPRRAFIPQPQVNSSLLVVRPSAQGVARRKRGAC